ncbi:DNA polymerase I [Listeria monocytogenes N53-1]|nr:DNA polymerase I [Listeria monocytogenes N53-1]
MNFTTLLKNIEGDTPDEIVTELKEKHFGGKTALYVELENDNYHTAQYILAKGRISLQWIESEQTKVVYDAKKTMVAMNRIGLAISVNPSDSIDDFTSVAVRHDYTEVETDEAVYGKGKR